jgi:hypothetical protein
MKRCSRQKWLVKAQQDKAAAVVMSPNALSANVRKGSDVLSEVLAEDSRATRIGLSAAARKAAEHLAASQATKIVRKHHALRSITQSAAELHYWNQKHPAESFNLNVLNMGEFAIQIRKNNEEQRSEGWTSRSLKQTISEEERPDFFTAITCNQRMQSQAIYLSPMRGITETAERNSSSSW